MKKYTQLSMAAAVFLIIGGTSLMAGWEEDSNTFYGLDAGAGETGSSNSGFGKYTGLNVSGAENVFVGKHSGDGGVSGDNNTFVGSVSGSQTTSGENNTFLGMGTGYSNNTGSGNVYIGTFSGYGGDRNNTLMIENSDDVTTPLVYGEFDNDLVRINGSFVVDGTVTTTDAISSSWAGSNTVDDGLSTLVLLDANNTEADKASDAGFGLKNAKDDFQWNFRTLEYNEAFTATKLGSGGGEFVVQSPTTDYRDAIVKVAGVTIFEDGHLVTASSRELKTDIQPLDTEAALEAFDKLQPVSYAYKGHKDEAVVGFIAEDVPELVAMPSKKSIDSTEIVAVLASVLAETRAEMEAMRNESAVKEAKNRNEIEAMKVELAELKGMK